MESIDFKNLNEQISLLVNGLFHWWNTAPGIDPLDELDDDDKVAFIYGLYALSHESLCISQRVNADPLQNYQDLPGAFLSRKGLIKLTRQLLQLCNLERLAEYRRPESSELWVVRLLEQCLGQLIYSVYQEHPHVSTLLSSEVRFCKPK